MPLGKLNVELLISDTYRMVITHQTVKGYVSNILAKQNGVDRTQAAIYAWRLGLVSADDDVA